MRGYLEEISRNRFWVRMFFVSLRDNIILGLFVFLKNFFYSWYLSSRLFGLSLVPRVGFSGCIFKVHIKNSGSVIYTGHDDMAIVFQSWLYGNSPSSLVIECNGELHLGGRFYIGNGVKVSVGKNAKLYISGGVDLDDVSGITSDSIIICNHQITIGNGTIISWGCYLSDSTQHSIKYNNIEQGMKFGEVKIGNHVWISEGVTCSPGTIVGSGSIVGAKSYTNRAYPNNVLIVGIPAIVKRNVVTWTR
jgi:acetyltransferase-like isoleucine patch superfamily enzyme